MIIQEETNRPHKLIVQLCSIWEMSVRATHLFLSENDIREISRCIPSALMGIPHLITGCEKNGNPAAFLGIAGQKVEMLFVHPDKRGEGIGKMLFVHPDKRGEGIGRRLMEYGQKKYAIKEVCVNEQNPQARGFYERLGFSAYKRTECDEQGAPFPLLHMKRT